MRSATLAVAAAVAAATASPARAQENDVPAAQAARIEAQTSEVLDRARPAVVTVTVTPRSHAVPQLAFPGLTIMLPGARPDPLQATGILVAADGHILTTLSLFQNAAHVEVRYANGRAHDARVVGFDGPFQAALLRTAAPREGRPLDETVTAPISGPSVGWFVHCGDRGAEVQMATFRPTEAHATSYDRYLAAPLALRPGAAGGPLLDDRGRLLGMAVREVSRPGTGTTPRPNTLFVRGEDLAAAARALIANKPVPRPMLGVVVGSSGSRVDQIVPDSPAEKAGLVEGDRVVAVEDTVVSSLEDLTRALLRRSVGDSVTVDVERGGRRFSHRVTLAPFQMPALPTVAPIAGTMLRLDPAPSGTETPALPPVVVMTLDGKSPAAEAGLRVGDHVMSIEGESIVRYLMRHRIRPRAEAPRRLVIERDGETRSILLRD